MEQCNRGTTGGTENQRTKELLDEEQSLIKKGLFKNLVYFEWWSRTFDDVQLGVNPSHEIRLDFVSDCQIQDNLHVIVQFKYLTTVNGI